MVFVTAIDFSVSEVVKRNPKFAVPTFTATIRNVLGLIFGLTDLEIPIELSTELHQAAIDRDLTKLNHIFNDIGNIKTNLDSPTPRDIVLQRIQEIKSFINWFLTSVDPAPNKGLGHLNAAPPINKCAASLQNAS